jgi:5'-methylthioadenosine phosphorylase
MVMGHMRANALNARRFIAAVLDELSKEEHEDLVNATHLQGAREFGISTAPAGRSQQATEKMKWLFEGYFES